jgi:hypothetical protein
MHEYTVELRIDVKDISLGEITKDLGLTPSFLKLILPFS